MASTDEPADGRPSVGVDAVSLRRFYDIETEEGEYIIYDRYLEDAWIQSDESYPCESRV